MLTEAAIIAVSTATTAVANLISKIVEGQPNDVKMQLWQWYIEDVKALREFFKIKT